MSNTRQKFIWNSFPAVLTLLCRPLAIFPAETRRHPTDHIWIACQLQINKRTGTAKQEISNKYLFKAVSCKDTIFSIFSFFPYEWGILIKMSRPTMYAKEIKSYFQEKWFLKIPFKQIKFFGRK